MTTAEWVFLDAGLFIPVPRRDDPRHAEARGIVEAARHGELAACTSVGVLAEVYAALTWVGAQPPHPAGGRRLGSAAAGCGAFPPADSCDQP